MIGVLVAIAVIGIGYIIYGVCHIVVMCWYTISELTESTAGKVIAILVAVVVGVLLVVGIAMAFIKG